MRRSPLTPRLLRLQPLEKRHALDGTGILPAAEDSPAEQAELSNIEAEVGQELPTEDWIAWSGPVDIRILSNQTADEVAVDDREEYSIEDLDAYMLNFNQGDEANQGGAIAFDVDGNGTVTPLDVLLVVDALSARRSSAGEQSFAQPLAAGTASLDVNADGRLSPLDALLIIEQLTHQQLLEGQALATDSNANRFAAPTQAFVDLDGLRKMGGQDSEEEQLSDSELTELESEQEILFEEVVEE